MSDSFTPGALDHTPMTLERARAVAKAYHEGGPATVDVLRALGLAQRRRHHSRNNEERLCWYEVYERIMVETCARTGERL